MDIMHYIWRFAIVSLLIFLLPVKVSSQDTVLVYKRPLVPNYYNYQFAGNMGALDFGIGYRMNRSRTVEWVLGVGFTPKVEATRRIINLNFRNIFIPYEWKLKEQWFLYPQVGIGISRFPKGNTTFITLPNRYPDRYYAPNAIRVHFNFGGKVRKEFDGRHIVEAVEFYVETTTNDLYLMYFLKSREVKPTDIFSMALGVNIVTHNLKTPGIVIKKRPNK